MIDNDVSIPVDYKNQNGYTWDKVKCTCGWSTDWLLSYRVNYARVYFEIHCQQVGQDSNILPPKPEIKG